MKKLFKILLITVISLTLALCVIACNKTGSNTGESIGVIEGNAGEYKDNIGTAYGEKPDLDTVVIDGLIDDELWQGKKWYTQYESTHRVKFQVTTAMSPKGFYLAAACNDNFIYWNGYNYFFSNTNFGFQFYSGNNTYITADANNTRVTHKYLNLRTRIFGQYNVPGKGGGMAMEFFIPWSELGIDVSKGLPEYVKILPTYNYASNPDTVTEALYPTFVKTTGDSGQVPKFGANGYLDGDADNAIIGSHKNGKGRTGGWTVENPGEATEKAISDVNATANFAQAIFFRDLISSTFRITSKIKVNKIGKDARVGMLIYSDDVKYRAVALSLNSDNYQSGKMTRYDLKGYTNYPYKITEITDLISLVPENGATDEIEMSLYNKSGKLYYIINGKYAYSEDASYTGLNAFGGFYAFNATAEFTDYSFRNFESNEEFDEEMAQYAYLVDLRVEGSAVEVTTDQLAVSRTDDNKLVITTTFKPGYTMDEGKFDYTIGNRTHSLHELFQKDGKGGVLTLTGIKGNISINAKGRAFTESDNATVNLKYDVRNAQTKEVLRSARVTVYGDDPYSRYYKLYTSSNPGNFYVRPGNVWKYEVTSDGYRNSSGTMLDGAVLNESLTENTDIFITNSVVGGTAESVLNPDGTPKTTITVNSVPGTMWDLSRETENKAVFQTSTNDKDVVFFSGRTISDFQVAYVEIVNRTDPASFSSFENDPAAGFIIKSGASESFMGLRKTGLRLKRERNNWTAGTYTDTNNVCSWSGYLGNTDRNNGGRFLNAYQGKGTVDRIPWEGKEYSNSFLMVRRGPYLYFYACDGSALVGTDATNFSKLSPVGTFYNDAIPECAAIGLTCTVAYNLRMDFENYWILTDDKASEFIIKAGLDLVTPFSITEGKELISLGGDAIIGYDDKAATFNGSIIKDGEVTLKAKTVPDGKLVKASFSDGGVRYLTDTRTELRYTPSPASGKITLKAELVDAVTVTGNIKFPDGLSSRALVGEVRSTDGKLVSSFYSAMDGKFSVKTEKGFKGTLAFVLDGYVMNACKLTGVDQNVGTLSFGKSNLGGSISFDGNVVNTAEGGSVRSDGNGMIFEYVSDNSGKGNLVIANANDYKGDFVLSFTYNRMAAGSKKEDSDPSIGVRFFQGGEASLECMFIGNGYRIYHDYDGGFDSRDEKRGSSVSPVNMQNIATMPYDFKVIKKGSVVYMLAKAGTMDNYKLVYSFDLYKFMSTDKLGFTIGWFSFGYQNMTVSNVVLEGITDSNATEITSVMTLTKGNGGNAVIEGANGNKGIIGAKYKIKVTPDAGMRVSSVKINGVEKIEQKSAEETVITFTATASDKIEVAFEKVVYTATAEAGRSRTEGAKYVKAVMGGEVRTFAVVIDEGKFNEDSVLVKGNNITIWLPEGEWTLSFYSDIAMTKQCGSDLKVTVTK